MRPTILVHNYRPLDCHNLDLVIYLMRLRPNHSGHSLPFQKIEKKGYDTIRLVNSYRELVALTCAR